VIMQPVFRLERRRQRRQETMVELLLPEVVAKFLVHDSPTTLANGRRQGHADSSRSDR